MSSVECYFTDMYIWNDPFTKYNYLMLGAGNLKTLSLSQTGSTICTTKNELTFSSSPRGKKGQVVMADFSKTEDFTSFTKENFIWLCVFKKKKKRANGERSLLFHEAGK